MGRLKTTINQVHRQSFEIAKTLLRLPPGIKDTLFDGTVRKYATGWSYVGKCYKIELPEACISLRQDKAVYVALFQFERPCCYTGMDYELDSVDPTGLDLENRFNFKDKFISDLGPLFRLYTEVEVPRDFIKQE